MRRQSIRAIRQQEDQKTSLQPEQGTPTQESDKITAEQQNIITAKTHMLDLDDEKATEKLTLYLHPSQRDKLDELIIGYKKQTGKRITHNKLMRILIEQADLASLV